jgi:hypothetical protein
LEVKKRWKSGRKKWRRRIIFIGSALLLQVGRIAAGGGLESLKGMGAKK